MGTVLGAFDAFDSRGLSLIIPTTGSVNPIDDTRIYYVSWTDGHASNGDRRLSAQALNDYFRRGFGVRKYDVETLQIHKPRFAA